MKGRSRGRQEGTEGETCLAPVLERMNEDCRFCHPLTPLECADSCEVWRSRNELRKLREVMFQVGYVSKLLNALKNERRLRILEMLSKAALSVVQLQKGLRKLGYVHSRKTIMEEYVEPLVSVGLIRCNSSRYRSTMLGRRISQLFSGFHGIGDALPPHSECYEERLIEELLDDAKTYEELRKLVPTKSLSRVVKRLQEANLVATSDSSNYVFYFKTKRNPQQERLSPTERRVHENISVEGITAEDLAEKTGISLRRTYMYLRKLRGKKLAFKRKQPKAYVLTMDGVEVAKLLKRMRSLLMDFAQTSMFAAKPEVVEVDQVSDSTEGKLQKLLEIPVKS